MTSLLFTMLFLLADGSPASKAYVVCEGLVTFEAGNDDGAPGGNELIIDSRGAAILSVEQEDRITCFAQKGTQTWGGPLVFRASQRVMRIYLKEPK